MVFLNRVNVLNEDVCNLSGDKILKAAKIKKDDIYLFAGCPPCQNFSRQNPLTKSVVMGFVGIFWWQVSNYIGKYSSSE